MSADETATGEGIKAGSAFVEIGADTSAVDKAISLVFGKISDLQHHFARIGIAFAGFGASITAPFESAVEVFTDYGSELKAYSDIFGFSAKTLGELSYAANRAGADLGSVAKGVIFLGRSLDKALQEGDAGKEAASMFRGLGLDPKELNKLSGDAQFNAVASAIAEIADPAERAAAAWDIFGKSARNLIPVLAEFADMKERAEKFGTILSDKEVDEADKLDKAVRDLSLAYKGLSVAVGSILARSFRDFYVAIAEVVNSFRMWVKENPQVITSLMRIGVTLTVIGSTILGVIGAIAAFGVIFGPTGVIGAVVTGLGVLLANLLDVDLGFQQFYENVKIGGNTIKQWLGKAWEAVLASGTYAFTSLADGWSTFKIAVFQGANLIVTGIAEMFDKITNMMAAWFDGAIKGWADWAREIGAIGADTYNRLNKFRADMRSSLKTEYGSASANYFAGLMETEDAAMEARAKDREAALKKMRGFLGEITDPVRSLYNSINDAVSTFGSGKKGGRRYDPFSGAMDSAQASAPARAVIGTFSGALASRFGFNASVQDKQLQEMQKSRKELESIDEKLGDLEVGLT